MSSTYNSTEYWLKRGKTYYDELPRGWGPVERQQLLDYLHKTRFDSMLEVGCGYGRVTKWIYDEFKPTRYDAIDLSPDQIIKARELVQQGVNFAVKTIQEFETTLSYDLVFAAEVLLHVMPSEIECVIAKLLRLGRHLVHIDPIKGDNLHPHNFIHNYAEIYTKLGKTVDMVEVKATGQHIIHVC